MYFGNGDVENCHTAACQALKNNAKVSNNSTNNVLAPKQPNFTPSTPYDNTNPDHNNPDAVVLSDHGDSVTHRYLFITYKHV